jgi:hypothetical protein
MAIRAEVIPPAFVSVTASNRAICPSGWLPSPYLARLGEIETVKMEGYRIRRKQLRGRVIRENEFGLARRKACALSKKSGRRKGSKRGSESASETEENTEAPGVVCWRLEANRDGVLLPAYRPEMRTSGRVEYAYELRPENCSPVPPLNLHPHGWTPVWWWAVRM